MDDIKLFLRKIEMSKLEFIYEIAREKNLTKAAHKLNITQPALSKALIKIEERIQMKLFDRVPNGMRLTPQGERLYLHAKEMIEKHSFFGIDFLEVKEEIRGDFEITTYPYVGAEWLVSVLKGFLKSYPNLFMSIQLEPDIVSPVKADVAICPYIPHQNFLIQKKLFDVNHQFYASKEYISKFGNPQSPEELDAHRLITYREDYYSPSRSTNRLTNIARSTKSPRKPYFRVDSLHGMLNAALEGYGIVELPNFPKIVNSGLELILPRIKGETIPMHYIFHENRKDSKKIKALYSYLIKIINSNNCL